MLEGLEALWPEAEGEIDALVHGRPRELTTAAVDRLVSLPGYEAMKSLARTLHDFAPPRDVGQWPGISEDTPRWLSDYAEFVWRAFHRREFPAWADDPARSFGEWLLSEPTVVLKHPRHGYVAVAEKIRTALEQGRRVLVVMIDALAIHLAPAATSAVSEALECLPSEDSYVLAPLPTITRVCKEAILTGRYPSKTTGDTERGVLQAFSLRREELCVLASWRDAEQTIPDAKHRLVLYLDNRIDDLLSSETSYRRMAMTAETQLLEIGRIVGRLAHDIRHQEGELPLVLLTADHGFTYGPSSVMSTVARGVLSNGQRCAPVERREPDIALDEGEIAFLDKASLKLRRNYLAANSRNFGKSVQSGWTLAHGGLLPEEVIVPLVEWSGVVRARRWPTVRVPGSGLLEGGALNLTVILDNPLADPTLGGVLGARLKGGSVAGSGRFEPLGPRASQRMDIAIPQVDLSGASAEIEITLEPFGGDLDATGSQRRFFSVPIRRMLVDRTEAQSDFEDMF